MESVFGKGSRFHFSIRGRVPRVSEELMTQRMAPFKGRKILYLDTHGDETGVEQALEYLMLQPTIVKSTPDIANISDGLEGGKLPFEAVIVSSLSSVSQGSLQDRGRANFSDGQAQSLRDLEHLRFMPLVLLAPASHGHPHRYVCSKPFCRDIHRPTSKRSWTCHKRHADTFSCLNPRTGNLCPRPSSSGHASTWALRRTLPLRSAPSTCPLHCCRRSSHIQRRPMT